MNTASRSFPRRMVAKSACIWRPGSVSNRISGSGLATGFSVAR